MEQNNVVIYFKTNAVPLSESLFPQMDIRLPILQKKN